MKRRKLKAYVMPTLYLLITISIFTGIILLSSDYDFAMKDYNYSINALEERVESVISEDEMITSEISSPIENEEAEISISFYSKDDDEIKQQNSLIFYQNTYLPSTGILYTSDNTFNVLNVFSGKVSEINDDEFFGKCVVIEHVNNIKTYYYGVTDLEVEVGDELTTNAVIGVSNNNEILSNKKSLLFEVYHNNKLINPESFIGNKITDYE